MTGLGALSLLSGEVAYVWHPIPPWAVGHPALAYGSGALLLGLGAGLLGRQTSAIASQALTVYSLASIALVHLPDVASHPGEEVRWYNVGEVAIFTAGALVLFAAERPARLARVMFGASLLPIGLSHFVYTEATVVLVPSWIPGHLVWAYLTGVAHLAAGLALLFKVLPRLAATLESLMVSVFVLTIHLPAVARTPGDHDAWTELFVACAVGGAAALVAHSVHSSPWLETRGPGLPS
jgi:uncharacterized membrane protein